METPLAHALGQTEFDARYDKTAKKLLANKQILAQIMKGCVTEYSGCSVKEIAEKYIEGIPEVGSVGVHADDTNRPTKSSGNGVINGSNNEDSTLTEGTIYYDVRFDAIAPTSESSTASKDVIRIIINVEAQTDFNPGYPLTKRAIYILWPDALRTAWAGIHKVGVWETPESVLDLDLYQTNGRVSEHAHAVFHSSGTADWKCS